MTGSLATAISAITAVGIISFMTNAPRSKERGVKMPERKDKEKYNIPLWHKPNLSIEEAVAYSGIGTGIGRDTIYKLIKQDDCNFTLRVGKRTMIKRKRFEEYLEKLYSI